MIKTVLLNIIGYLYDQVYHDRCTPQEMASFYKTIVENVKVDATVSDIAEHFGQSESNVCNVIARSYVGKPIRRVYYNFMRFIKHAPKEWYNQQQHASA